MGRLLLLHVVFDYTQNGKLTDWTIKRPWWPLNSSTATNPHWKFLTKKCMKFAPKMGWSYILLPDHTCRVMVLFNLHLQYTLWQFQVTVVAVLCMKMVHSLPLHKCLPRLNYWNTELLFYFLVSLLSPQ
jgi:hypothetical protein